MGQSVYKNRSKYIVVKRKVDATFEYRSRLKEAYINIASNGKPLVEIR